MANLPHGYHRRAGSSGPTNHIKKQQLAMLGHYSCPVPNAVPMHAYMSDQGPPLGLCAFGCIRRGRHDHMTYSSEGGSNAAETSTVERPFVPMTSMRPETTTLPRGGSIGVGPLFFLRLCMKSASVTGLSSPRGTIDGKRGMLGEPDGSPLDSASLPPELGPKGGDGRPFGKEPCDDTPGGFVPGPKCFVFGRSLRCALMRATSGSIFGCRPKYSRTLFACKSNWYRKEAHDALMVAVGMIVLQRRAYSFCDTVLTDQAMKSSVISMPCTSYS